jgi:carbon-monoxide dehydrogenase medium subunit
MSKMEFARPTSVESAVSLLASREGSRCIAGGQTLVAMMNAGLIEAPVLIALSGIAELGTITKQPTGAIRIGATVCHRDVARSHVLEGANIVVREAAQVIAHPAIRNFGTIGGALAHADPAADYPTAIVAAGAHIEIAGNSGRRLVPAEEFFLDYLTTVLETGEMVTALLLPASNEGSSGHYLKFSRVDGDYAIVSVGVTLKVKGGVCTAVRFALGGCGPSPVFDAAANNQLVGTKCDEQNIAAAAKILADRADPADDVRASADYRHALIPKLLHRAIQRVWRQANGAN